jgi:hypothetical protein
MYGVRMLALPPWAAAARREGRLADDGSCACAVDVASWAEEIAIGVTAYGVALWHLQRGTLLLCFGHSLTHPLGPAGMPPPSSVVSAIYRPRDEDEAQYLVAQARTATDSSISGARGACQGARSGRTLALLFVSLRTRRSTAGFWSCLHNDGGGGEPSDDATLDARTAEAGIWGRRGEEESARAVICLLALTAESLTTLYTYRLPPTASTRLASAARDDENGTHGLDSIDANRKWLAGLSESLNAAFVWSLDSGECVAAIRLPHAAVHVRLLSLGPSEPRACPTGGMHREGWALLCARRSAVPALLVACAAAGTQQREPCNALRTDERIAEDAGIAAGGTLICIRSKSAGSRPSENGIQPAAVRRRAEEVEQQLQILAAREAGMGRSMAVLSRLSLAPAHLGLVPMGRGGRGGKGRAHGDAGRASFTTGGFVTGRGSAIALRTDVLKQITSMYSGVLDDPEADNAALSLETQ